MAKEEFYFHSFFSSLFLSFFLSLSLSLPLSLPHPASLSFPLPCLPRAAAANAPASLPPPPQVASGSRLSSPAAGARCLPTWSRATACGSCRPTLSCKSGMQGARQKTARITGRREGERDTHIHRERVVNALSFSSFISPPRPPSPSRPLCPSLRSALRSRGRGRRCLPRCACARHALRHAQPQANRDERRPRHLKIFAPSPLPRRPAAPSLPLLFPTLACLSAPAPAH